MGGEQDGSSNDSYSPAGVRRKGGKERAVVTIPVLFLPGMGVAYRRARELSPTNFPFQPPLPEKEEKLSCCLWAWEMDSHP